MADLLAGMAQSTEPAVVTYGCRVAPGIHANPAALTRKQSEQR